MKYNVELIERKVVVVDDLEIILEIGRFFDEMKKKIFIW